MSLMLWNTSALLITSSVLLLKFWKSTVETESSSGSGWEGRDVQEMQQCEQVDESYHSLLVISYRAVNNIQYDISYVVVFYGKRGRFKNKGFIPYFNG